MHLATEKDGEDIIKLIVKLLLEFRTNVNSKNKNDKTIQRFAVEQGCPIIVGHMLKHFADLYNKSNSSVINIAVHGCEIGYSKTFTDLLQYGFTVNSKSANNFMHAAVEKGCVKIVEELLTYGAHVNKLYKSALGKGSLHVAIKSGQKEVAKLLINYGY